VRYLGEIDTDDCVVEPVPALRCSPADFGGEVLVGFKGGARSAFPAYFMHFLNIRVKM
jgi:hypothetical protein